MDPITLATITAAATVIGVSVLRGNAPEADKVAWAELQEVFPWDKQPTLDELAATIAYHISEDDDIAGNVVYIIKTQTDRGTSSLLGAINMVSEGDADSQDGDDLDDNFNVSF